MATAASSREEFFNIVHAADPRSYVIMHEKLEYFTNKKYAPPIPPFTPKFQEFLRVPQEMKDWVTTELIKVHIILFIIILLLTYYFQEVRPKTLVVWGPSRTGKTSWARSLGPHSYLNSAWNMEDLDQDKDYIIFNDVDFESFRTWQAFLGKHLSFYCAVVFILTFSCAGAQETFTVTDKYRGKKTLCGWSKPCIWLNNQNPLDCNIPEWKKDWL
jgi:hypothetical protein